MLRSEQSTMPPEEYSDTFYKGPAYALVIGISKYHNGREPGQELGPKEFAYLKFADQDALDFADFLEKNGFIKYNIKSLTNEQATCARIKGELENLRKHCSRSESETENPLVIVYFSGHGMADDNNRHFLIPFDAERDNLVGTALKNKDFSDQLNELATNRLVVLLDACHAGAMGTKDSKEGARHYNPEGLELGEGSGRYLLASCRSGQKSYEGEKNGIFTGHLLELLKCETNDIKDEEIDIFNLYRVLKKKVMDTALKIHGQDQEPILKIPEESTGITLAINKPVRDERINREKKDREHRQRFLKTICEAFEGLVHDPKPKLDPKQKAYIKTQLENYLESRNRDIGFEDFYYLVDWYLENLDLDDEKRVRECCERLVEKQNKMLTSLRRQKESDSLQPREPIDKSKEPESQRPREPIDKFMDAVENKTLGSDRPATLPSAAPTRNQQSSKRRFSDGDCKYVLEPISSRPEYFTLIYALSQPLSKAAFTTKLHNILSKNPTDLELGAILADIVERFGDRWDSAKEDVSTEEVEHKKLSEIMMEKGKE